MTHKSALTERQQFMLRDGAVLYTDVQDRMLSDLDPQIPSCLTERELRGFSLIGEYGNTTTGASVAAENIGGISLYAAMQKVRKLTPRTDHNNVESFLRQYGVSGVDIDKIGDHASYGGFLNLDFTHSFAAGIANEVTEAFIADGCLTREQKDSLSVTDWADLIRTGWFGNLVEDMAFGGNGAYGPYASNTRGFALDPAQGGLTRALVSSGVLHSDFEQPLFEVSTTIEPQEGFEYLIASLTQPVRQALRKHMERSATRKGSVGCPVARHVVTLPRDEAMNDPHTRRLMNAGALAELALGDKSKIRLYQETTAIDRTLLQAAKHLTLYDELYGTPRVYNSGSPDTQTAPDVLRHEKILPSGEGLLWWPAPQAS